MTIQAKPISIDRDYEETGMLYVKFDDGTEACINADDGDVYSHDGSTWAKGVPMMDRPAYYAAAKAFAGFAEPEATAPRVWTRDDVLFSLRQLARDATAGSRQDWQAPTDAQLGYLAGLLLADAQRRNATGNPVDGIRGTVLTRRMASTWIEQLSNAAG